MELFEIGTYYKKDTMLQVKPIEFDPIEVYKDPTYPSGTVCGIMPSATNPNEAVIKEFQIYRDLIYESTIFLSNRPTFTVMSKRHDDKKSFIIRS